MIAFIISFLLVNYYYGKQYHPCKDINCKESEIFFVDVNPLPYNLVNILENAIRKNGSQLNPKYNNGNAQGKKNELL